MTVTVHLKTQSEPVIHEKVRNAYQKGDLYCVMTIDTFGGREIYKYPIADIFRVKENP